MLALPLTLSLNNLPALIVHKVYQEPEVLKSGVGGLFVIVAVIYLLHDNRQAENAIHFIKGKVFGAVVHFAAIVFYYFFAGKHTGKVRWLTAGLAGYKIIIGLYPVGQRVAKVHQRVAYSGHFPIQYANYFHRVVKVQHYVVETKIVMDEATSFFGGDVCFQPVHYIIATGHVPCFRFFVALRPAVYLPFAVAGA